MSLLGGFAYSRFSGGALLCVYTEHKYECNTFLFCSYFSAVEVKDLILYINLLNKFVVKIPVSDRFSFAKIIHPLVTGVA